MKIENKLSLSENDSKTIMDFLIKKFIFDERVLEESDTTFDHKLFYIASLQRADYLVQALDKNPDHITEEKVKVLIGHIREAQQLYKHCFESMISDGAHANALEYQAELVKAEFIHELLNEFLIECIEE
jgi:hypothetical protein